MSTRYPIDSCEKPHFPTKILVKSLQQSGVVESYGTSSGWIALVATTYTTASLCWPVMYNQMRLLFPLCSYKFFKETTWVIVGSYSFHAVKLYIFGISVSFSWFPWQGNRRCWLFPAISVIYFDEENFLQMKSQLILSWFLTELEWFWLLLILSHSY